jgi:hypothetical protein
MNQPCCKNHTFHHINILYLEQCSSNCYVCFTSKARKNVRWGSFLKKEKKRKLNYAVGKLIGKHMGSCEHGNEPSVP